MAITITAQDIRDVLGPYARGWSDDQMLSSAILLPAQLALLRMCPAVDDIVDQQDIKIAQVALASIVASNLITASPHFTSSSVGESSVSFATNSEAMRADRLFQQAASLMEEVCPVDESIGIRAFFFLAPGGRGK